MNYEHSVKELELSKGTNIGRREAKVMLPHQTVYKSVSSWSSEVRSVLSTVLSTSSVHSCLHSFPFSFEIPWQCEWWRTLAMTSCTYGQPSVIHEKQVVVSLYFPCTSTKEVGKESFLSFPLHIQHPILFFLVSHPYLPFCIIGDCLACCSFVFSRSLLRLCSWNRRYSHFL